MEADDGGSSEEELVKVEEEGGDDEDHEAVITESQIPNKLQGVPSALAHAYADAYAVAYDEDAYDENDEALVSS